MLELRKPSIASSIEADSTEKTAMILQLSWTTPTLLKLKRI